MPAKPAKPDGSKGSFNSNAHWISTALADHGKVVLGIGGGVGPSAGVGLHNKIIYNTRTDGTDQSHFQVIHVSRSPHVLDRTKFLLGEIDVNPGEGMADSINALRKAAEINGNIAICAVPCNTFHAPTIWNRFMQRLEELGSDGSTLRVVHMLEETVKMIKEISPNCKNVGLMSTTGTRSTRVYRDLLEPQGYTVTEVPEADQANSFSPSSTVSLRSA
jgi:aspartate racemase